MKFNIFNLKNLKRCVLSSIMLIGFSQGTTSYAGPSVTPMYLGKSSSYYDSDVPPAIRLNESYDGLAKGTYLYRVKYRNICYYTPVTPQQYRDTVHEPSVNVQYRNWGPWMMAQNKISLNLNTTTKYRSRKKYQYPVTIKAGTRVEGPKLTEPDTPVDIGVFSSPVTVEVRASTELSKQEYIYFSLKGTPLNGANKENIGRVKRERVSTSETPLTIFRTSSSTANNFSYLGNYADTTDSSHINLVKGTWLNSSNAPDGLGGQYGEWGCLGYNSKGEPLTNPYFPSWSLHFLGSSETKYYDWRLNPFAEKSTFDSSAYNNDKRELLGKMYDREILSYGSKESTINYYINRFSYLTHPTKDIAILRGKRTATSATRKLSIENVPGDLYVANIDVYDGSTKVAYYSYDINTGRAVRSNGQNITQGRTYTVKVYIGNSENRKILATKNEATVGITKNSQFLNLSTLSSKNLTNVKTQEQSNSIGSFRGSKSSAFSFSVTAPYSDVFDIYGMIGDSHDGTDNMDTGNDAGFVRMYTTEAFVDKEVVSGSANLKAMRIELLDASTNAVVYSSSGNIVNTAIIPGKSYKIRYVMKNTGDRPTITIHTPGYEGSNGVWYPGETITSYPDVEVPISYTNTLKVNNSSGGISDVSVSGSNKKVTVNGSTKIKLQKNTEYTYTTEALYFANPYLYSTFTINATGLANSNRSDDTARTTIQDLYDAVIRDVKIYPAYEYVSNGDRNVSFNVTYKAKIDAATHIKNAGNVSSKVNTSINVGNRTLTFEDILIAKDGYQEFSHTIDNVLLRRDTTGVKATVNINFDKKIYETNYNNNKGESSYSVVKAVSNPFNGSNSDTVKRVDTSNGSSLNGGGVSNNNCLIPRRNNSWTVSHRKYNWGYTSKSYNLDGTSYTSKIYSISNESTVNKSYNESFQIKQILFKSKETQGLGKNGDGWVDLLLSKEAPLAIIKSGYGFELKIVSEYRTNATKTQPTPSGNTIYTGIIGRNDISYSNDIFVELPGTEGANGTRKILSTTGYSGTTNGLIVTEKDLSTTTEVVKEFTYTIKPSNTLGIKETGKIFIPVELKNGKYKISVYTPPIAGASSNGKNNYTSLCDRRDVYIEVKGTYTDDLDSNIIQ